jgi:hypothetical protein
LIAWVRAELKSRPELRIDSVRGVEPVDTGATSEAAPQANGIASGHEGAQESHRVTEPASAPESAASAGDSKLSPSPANESADTRSSLMQLGISAGIELLVGILESPRVRDALRELLAQSLPTPTQSETKSSGDAPRSPEAMSKNAPILIAGVTPLQATELERAYKGTIHLIFWTTEQSTDELADLAGRACLVIAIMSAIGQAVDSSLSRLARTYIRHTSGLSGLRARLASLALDPKQLSALRNVA